MTDAEEQEKFKQFQAWRREQHMHIGHKRCGMAPPDCVPCNRGRIWTLDNYKGLFKAVNDGLSIAEMCVNLNRTTSGIISRLSKSGLAFNYDCNKNKHLTPRNPSAQLAIFKCSLSRADRQEFEEIFGKKFETIMCSHRISLKHLTGLLVRGNNKNKQDHLIDAESKALELIQYCTDELDWTYREGVKLLYLPTRIAGSFIKRGDHQK